MLLIVMRWCGSCPGMECVLCAVLCTAQSTHAILGHAATPPRKINDITLLNVIISI